MIPYDRPLSPPRQVSMTMPGAPRRVAAWTLCGEAGRRRPAGRARRAPALALLGAAPQVKRVRAHAAEHVDPERRGHLPSHLRGAPRMSRALANRGPDRL